MPAHCNGKEGDAPLGSWGTWVLGWKQGKMQGNTIITVSRGVQQSFTSCIVALLVRSAKLTLHN